MKFCFPPGILFTSPPLTKRLQGKIFFKIGKYAEDHIADDYQKFTGRKDWYPKPITADDFKDGNQQLSSKTLYFSFLIEKNPDVDKAKLEELMNQRAIPGPDGQLLYIPDFISEKAPAAKRFYEVKPGIAHEDNQAGETKIASVRSLMQDVDLPYMPGTLFKPTGRHELYRQIVFIPGAMILPLPITITLEYQRHDKIDGLVVYSFCIDADFKTALAMALIIAVVAVIVLAVLFPELLKDIPLPPIPIPIPRELPPPMPSPIPAPDPRVPVPAIFQQFRNLLSAFPASGSAPDIRARALTGSVGIRGRNARDDVQVVQFLLNAWQGFVRRPFLALDGLAGPLTNGAIVALQQAAGLRAVDGRVDPGGPTLEVLGKLGAIGIAMTLRNTPRSIHVLRNSFPPLQEGDLLSVFWSSLVSRGRG
jgi:hypothetical protein